MRFPFTAQRNSYTLLPERLSSESSSIEAKELGEASSNAVSSRGCGSYFTLLLCIVFTVINGYFAYLGLGSCECPLLPSDMSRKDINLLRRPSQYMYFDTIPRPQVPIARNFTNFPIFTGFVDSRNPFHAFERNAVVRSVMTHVGTIYPEDKRVRVTNSISTVVQFRAIDWGMEICELHFNLPRTDTEIQVSVFRLASDLPIDADTLTFNSRPKRVSKLADITTQSSTETHWQRKLSCSLEEVLTFEVACSSLMADPTQCNLDWWQLAEKIKEPKSDPGVYIIQHATK